MRRGLLRYVNVVDNPFIITVKSDNAGTSGTDQFTIPTDGVSTYLYNVETSDGYTASGITGNHTITFPSGAGTYDVLISGDFPVMLVNNTGDRLKILDIKQWGIYGIGGILQNNSFYGCANLGVITAIDAPDLTICTSTARMFRNCTSFNSDISHWDMSNIENINEMFRAATSFNQDISSWNVGNVKTMTALFLGATSFNQPIGIWNVSNVTIMQTVFDNASSFNQDISGWNVGNVNSMSNMFSGASLFNQNISGWNVGNVDNMSLIFSNASSFNQPIGIWNVSKVTNMSFSFRGATSFNQDIGDWNVSLVISFGSFMAGKVAANYDAANLDAIYNKWSLLTLQPNIVINFNTIKYTAAGQAGRDILTGAPNNWDITDGGI